MPVTGSGIGTATVRCLGTHDAGEVQRLHARLDQHDSYMRWFGPQPKQLSAFADQLCECNDRRCALGAFVGEELVGVGSFVVLDGVSPTTVEFALVVARDERLHGIGTLLLDHLEDEAYRHGARRMVAEVMGENAPMLQVIRERGWAHSLRRDGSTLHLEVKLHVTE